MLLDSTNVESNYKHFLQRAVESETVYYLSNDEGVANSVSNDDEEVVILMFWSDRAYATSVNNVFDDAFVETEMSLFELLYYWLPGMSGDGVLAGPNWNGDLVGNEIDPLDLRTEIEECMPSELLEKYEERFHEHSDNT